MLPNTADQAYAGIRSFHSIHNAVDRGVIQAMREELSS